jgi:hypothetical protein
MLVPCTAKHRAGPLKLMFGIFCEMQTHWQSLQQSNPAGKLGSRFLAHHHNQD